MPSSLADLPLEISSELKRVCEVAYSGLSKKDIQLTFTNCDFGEAFKHLGLLVEAKEMFVEGAKSFYSFPHLSIQEFLAAWHLVCSPLFNACDFFTIQGFVNLKKFVAGLLGCNNFPLQVL